MPRRSRSAAQGYLFDDWGDLPNEATQVAKYGMGLTGLFAASYITPHVIRSMEQYLVNQNIANDGEGITNTRNINAAKVAAAAGFMGGLVHAYQHQNI